MNSIRNEKSPRTHYCRQKSIQSNCPLKILSTSWTIQGSKPGGGEIFRTRPDRPQGPPSLLNNGYRVCFLGFKRPGRGVNHPPPSSADVKERVELYPDSPSGRILALPFLPFILSNRKLYRVYIIRFCFKDLKLFVMHFLEKKVRFYCFATKEHKSRVKITELQEPVNGY